MIPAEPSSDGDPLADLAEEFADRYRRGERPAVTEYVERYPELAERIRKLFPAMVVMEEFGSIAGPDTIPPGSRGTPPQQLGDYRILREVGRGGMGVVYEAVQESLGRHVALKVLAAQNWTNAVHIERFRREARAVARLHHTNIVPVFGVGESDGVHFYAMQYIHGQSLDSVLDEVRRLRHERSVGAAARTIPVDPGKRRPALSASIAQGLITGEFNENEGLATATFVASPSVMSAASQSSSAHPGRPIDGNRSELTTGTDSAYPRGVARIGVQAAEALSYAHGQGILHRDIKPANLLLDTHGTIWVTDFGLAKTDDSSELTRAGDIVGTVRYMAPERFRGEADPRSDVYALGLTLYEMLTLRAAFDDSDRPQLMEAIARKNPPAPRVVDQQIPRDLETVVLKAIAKDPADRYATAADLTEDLRRFLADRPILARRTTWVEHGWRWCRRNPVIAGLLATVASLLIGLVFVLAVANSTISGALEQEKRARSDLEQTLYYQWIAAAADARDKQRNAIAEELLDRCPARLRGFEWHYLKNLPFSSRPPIHNGSDVILPMRYSPDGQRLAVATRNGRVTVWDVRTGKPALAPFQAQKEFIRGAVFSPDGRYLATGGQDDQVKLWDSHSGALIREFPIGRTVVLLALAISPDGRRLAASDQDRRIHIWDLETGAATTLGSSQPLANGALEFSTDGRQLLAVATEGTVSAWNVGDATLSPVFDAATPGIVGAAFSQDRHLIALGCEDGTVKVLQSGPWKVLWRLEAHTEPIHGLAFGAGGDTLASSSPGATIRFWDMRTGQEALSVDFAGQRWNSLAFNPEGNRMAAGSAEGEIRILDGTPLEGPGGGGQLLTLEGHRHMVGWLAYSPDGRRIASASWDGTARLWDADSGRELRTLSAGESALTQVIFDRDGGRVAAAGWDGAVRVWQTDTGAEVYPPLRALAGPVYGVAFDRDGRTLVSAHHDGTVRVWDAKTGRSLRVVPAHAHPVLGLAFSPDGQFLVTAEGKGRFATVWKWGPESQEPVLTLNVPTGILRSPVFAPDGKSVVAITSATRTVSLWDVTPGQSRERDARQFTLPGTGKLNQAIFHSDGQRLVVVSDDQVQVLNPQTGEVESIAAPHAGSIGCAVLSPDGKFLATGAGYRGRGEIRVWDLARFRKKE